VLYLQSSKKAVLLKPRIESLKELLLEKDGLISGRKELAAMKISKQLLVLAEKDYAKMQKAIVEFKEEIRELKKSNEMMKKIYSDKQMENEYANNEENMENAEKENQESGGVDQKKEILRLHRELKRKEKDIEKLKEERTNALAENLQQVRTIRNLNDNLDLLKRINAEREKRFDETISTKIAKNKLSDNGNNPMQLEDEQKNGDEEYVICSEYVATPSTEKLDSSQKDGRHLTVHQPRRKADYESDHSDNQKEHRRRDKLKDIDCLLLFWIM
jgi:hypothetical protein